MKLSFKSDIHLCASCSPSPLEHTTGVFLLIPGDFIPTRLHSYKPLYIQIDVPHLLHFNGTSILKIHNPRTHNRQSKHKLHLQPKTKTNSIHIYTPPHLTMSSPAELLTLEIDTLLEQYLQNLHTYTTLRSQLSSLQTSVHPPFLPSCLPYLPVYVP